MNKDNMRKLIDVLEDDDLLFYENDPVYFDMCTYFYRNDCETAACIAGHAAILSDQEDIENSRVFYIARNWLDLTEQEAGDLFAPSHIEIEEITKAEAVETLKNFLETGKVKWRLSR